MSRADEAVWRMTMTVLVVTRNVRIGLVLADVTVTIALVVVNDVDVGRSDGTSVLQVVMLGTFAVT
jgi:hypothetical protein